MHPAEGKKEGKHIVNLFARHYTSKTGAAIHKNKDVCSPFLPVL